MARRGTSGTKRIIEDPIFKDRLVAKLVNRSMRDGKKSVATKQVHEALRLAGEKLAKPGLEVFLQAIENIKPVVEVRPRRIGGAAYQVPMPVRGVRRESLAIRWMIQAARGKSSSEYKVFAEKLAAEIVDAYNNEGGAVKKREEVNRMAEANKAFAHFRW